MTNKKKLSKINLVPINDKLVPNYCYLSVLKRYFTSDICFKEPELRQVKVLTSTYINLLQKKYLEPYKDYLVFDTIKVLKKQVIKPLRGHPNFNNLHFLKEKMESSKTIFDVLDVISNLIAFTLNEGCYNNYSSCFNRIIKSINKSYNYSLTATERNLVIKLSKDLDNIIMG